MCVFNLFLSNKLDVNQETRFTIYYIKMRCYSRDIDQFFNEDFARVGKQFN